MSVNKWNHRESGGAGLSSAAQATRFKSVRRYVLPAVLVICSGSLGEVAAKALQEAHTAASRTLASAGQLADAGKLREAEEAARGYLVEHADEAEAHYLLAYILFREDQPTPSLAEYTRAASLLPPSAKQLFYVALDYVLAQDYPDADKWMTQATERAPSDSEAWYSLGRIKYTENRFQESIACYEKALALSPHLVKAENNLGLAYEGLNQVDEAIKAYRTAIAWQAESPSPSEQPLVNLGIVLVDRNDLSEARPMLQQAVKIAPADARIRAALGRLYQKQGDLAAAQAELERAVALAPGTAAYHFLLGQVYRRSGLTEQAKSEFAKASALDAAHRPE